MKRLIKKILPAFLLRFYHRALALLAAAWYGHPSDKLIVIGVTGTNGKSTTVELIARMFEAINVKVGFTSTVRFKIADREWLNDKKMTMLGRFALQKLLQQMVAAGCSYVIIETSSEGIAQYRHLGINYDVAVFLNISPEHLESHGGFPNYRAAKAELFAHLARKPKKKLHETLIPKVSVVNLDDENAEHFLRFPADQKIGFSIGQPPLTLPLQAGGENQTVRAEQIEVASTGSHFTVDGVPFVLKLLGLWNVSHALAAISVGRAFGLPLSQIRDALSGVKGIPGRMEFIDEGQAFKVLVDYAPQPQSMTALYEFLKLLPRGRTIHVLGSAGGGRDRSRRPVLGEIASRQADYVIVTNEDPYDEDPAEIVKQVAAGAIATGKREGENLFQILDRRQAIRKAISLAGSGDLVLLTGKGAEQAIVTKGGKKIPWDEREEVRKAIYELSKTYPTQTR